MIARIFEEKSKLLMMKDKSAFRLVTTIQDDVTQHSLYYCANTEFDAWVNLFSSEEDEFWNHDNWVINLIQNINSGEFHHCTPDYWTKMLNAAATLS